MFFYLRNKATDHESLELIIPESEMSYAQRLALPLLPAWFRGPDPNHPDGTLFEFWVSDFRAVEIPRFLAYVGRQEVYHAQFLLKVLSDEMFSFAGSGDSASRLLRRFYKRLTKSGKSDPEAYVCDNRLDKGVSLMFHSELRLLGIIAGRNRRLLVGPDEADLAEIRSHFAPFDIQVEIS